MPPAVPRPARRCVRKSSRWLKQRGIVVFRLVEAAATWPAATVSAEAAEQARKAAAAFSLLTALSLLVGGIIGCVAGAIGGDHRDEVYQSPWRWGGQRDAGPVARVQRLQRHMLAVASPHRADVR